MIRYLRTLAIVLLVMVALMTFARRENSGWIAFSSDRDMQGSPVTLHLMTGNGTSVRRLMPKGTCYVDPTWSPNGRNIAVQACSNESISIYRVHVGGTNPLPLTEAYFYPIYNQWSPDSTRLLALNGADLIYLLGAEGNDEVILARDYALAQWSPDGEWVYARPRSLRDSRLDRINVETTEIQQSVDAPLHIIDLHWSPDGQQLLLVNKGLVTDQLLLMNPDGSNLHQINLDMSPMSIGITRWLGRIH